MRDERTIRRVIREEVEGAIGGVTHSEVMLWNRQRVGEVRRLRVERSSRVTVSVVRHKRAGEIQADKERRLALRFEVMSAYSEGPEPSCACCGECGVAFLTLDHVNGDGKAHRDALRADPTVRGAAHRGGEPFYRHLKKRGYPRDPPLRVMCANCNMAWGMLGECPHARAPLPTPLL